MKATKLSISFYPAHIEVIDHYAQTLGLRGNNVRSPTLQKILSEWAEARGYSLVTSASGRPMYSHTRPIAIGYSSLSDLMIALDPSQPVYVACYVETTNGSIPEQHTGHHYIVLTQPDSFNRVHYCRILVVRLVYHNGIAFALDYLEQLAQVDVLFQKIEGRLVEEGYRMCAGMAELPKDVILIEGRF